MKKERRTRPRLKAFEQHILDNHSVDIHLLDKDLDRLVMAYVSAFYHISIFVLSLFSSFSALVKLLAGIGAVLSLFIICWYHSMRKDLLLNVFNRMQNTLSQLKSNMPTLSKNIFLQIELEIYAFCGQKLKSLFVKIIAESTKKQVE